MKKHIIYILVLFCVPFFALAAKEKESNFKVAYVSVNEAVEKTGEQMKIRNALEKERLRIQKVIQKKSEGFKKEAMKAKKQMALLSEKEKMKKYESIQKMQLAMEQFVKGKEIEFQKKESNLRADIISRVKSVVSNVAKKEKVDIVRNKDGVLWVKPKLDFTDKVVRIYKKKYK